MGLVHDIPKAEDLINRIVAEASARLAKFAPARVAGRCKGPPILQVTGEAVEHVSVTTSVS